LCPFLYVDRGAEDKLPQLQEPCHDSRRGALRACALQVLRFDSSVPNMPKTRRFTAQDGLHGQPLPSFKPTNFLKNLPTALKHELYAFFLATTPSEICNTRIVHPINMISLFEFQ
jgi:hypothetical protein